MKKSCLFLAIAIAFFSASMALAGDTVFKKPRTETIDVGKKSAEWVFDAGDGYVMEYPVVRDGSVYFVVNDYEENPDLAIYSLKDSCGNLKWRFRGLKLSTGDASVPEVVKNVTYVAVGNETYSSDTDVSSLYAIMDDETRGWKLLWLFRVKGFPVIQPSSMASDDERLYFAMVIGGTTIQSLDRKTGSLVWKHELDESDAYITKIMAGKDIIVAYDMDELLICLDKTSGRPVWEIPADHLFIDAPLPSLSFTMGDDDTVYVGGERGFLCAIKDGRIVWRFKGNEKARMVPIIAYKNMLLVSCFDGSDHMYVINTENGKVMDAYEGIENLPYAPTVWGDRIYFSTDGCEGDAGVYVYSFGRDKRSTSLTKKVFYMDTNEPDYTFMRVGTFHEGNVYIGTSDGRLYKIRY